LKNEVDVGSPTTREINVTTAENAAAPPAISAAFAVGTERFGLEAAIARVLRNAANADLIALSSSNFVNITRPPIVNV